MIVLGLTGSIGMGKSTVAAMMKSRNIPVHESDVVVHNLLNPISPVRAAIAAAFPLFEYPQIYTPKTYSIKRKELGDLIFSNDILKNRLEEILHPFVRISQQEFLRHSRLVQRSIVCLDIPLLFETGADKIVDYVINVTAPPFLQEARVMARSGMTKERFKAILKTQMHDKQKCTRADFVIHSGLGKGYAMRCLQEILDFLQKDTFLNRDIVSKKIRIPIA